METSDATEEALGAYYFTPSPSADSIGAIKRYRAFKNVLIDIGYSVIDKEVKVIEDPQTDQKIKKANLDIEFALHVLTSTEAWDEAIFFTGDSDFACLMWHLRTHGKEVVAVSARGSVSREVRNTANRFVDLHRVRRSLERKEKRGAS